MYFFPLNTIPGLVCLYWYKKKREIKKNMRTTIINVKFDEETKSELRFGLPCEGKSKNAENCRKIIKLLVEKNEVKKYLVHQ